MRVSVGSRWVVAIANKMYIPQEGDIRETILKKSHILVYCASRSKEDVCRYERTLLLDRNEARHSQIHC